MTEYDIKTADLRSIIKPLRTARYEVDWMFNDLEMGLASYASDWGGMELDPDYQRGHVWTTGQQQHYIENILRGVVSTSGFVIQMNCPNWDNDAYAGDLPRGLQCIDGLQRITAARLFLQGDVKPFGLALQELEGSAFALRMFRPRFKFAIHNFQTRSELLTHYLDLNAGGTPHSAEELERVRGLLSEAGNSASTPAARVFDQPAP